MAFAELQEAPREPDLLRWCACGIAVLCVHAAVVLAIASRSDDSNVEAGAPVVMMDLAPVWAAPRAELSELPPGPQQAETERIEQVKQEVPKEQQEAAQLPELPPVPSPTALPQSSTTELKEQTPPTETRELPETEAQEEIHQEAAAASAAPSATAVDVRPAGPLPGLDQPTTLAEITSWQKLMAAQLERHKRYPPLAHGEQGVATLVFTIDRRGRLLNSRIVRSAGSAILDADALALISRTQPFPAPPPGIPDERLSITVPIRYIASPQQ